MELSIKEAPIQYDRWGRMKYHPDYHFNHGKPFTLRDLVYICKNYKRGQVKRLALAVGRTEHVVRSKVNTLRNHQKMGEQSMFDYYKSLNIE